MNENESFTLEDLDRCSYRYLQGVAKNMKLPSNVKKIHLINMIFAKKYRPASDLEAIIRQVKEERLSVSQTRVKQGGRKKKMNLQGKEVTSTNPKSPSNLSDFLVFHCSPNSKQAIMKYNPDELKPPNSNVLRPRIRAPSPRRSDRLLRSVANRQNYKYLLNNSVVIKSQNPSKKTQTHKICTNVLKKVPVDTRTKYIINQFKTSIVNNTVVKKNVNEMEIKTYTKNRPTPIITQPNPIRRQRSLSGIYPLNPPENHPKTAYISIRGKDGKLTKINAFIRPPKDYSIENHLEPPSQNSCVTVQDIINSNIDNQVKTKYMIANMESIRNKDYPNMFSVTEPMINNSALKAKAIEPPKYSTNNNDDKVKENRSLLLQKYFPEEDNTLAKKFRSTNPKVIIENNIQTFDGSQLPSPVTCCSANRIKENEMNSNRNQTTFNGSETVSIYSPEMVSNARSDMTTNYRPEIASNHRIVPHSRPQTLTYRPEMVYTQNHQALDQNQQNIHSRHQSDYIQSSSIFNPKPQDYNAQSINYYQKSNDYYPRMSYYQDQSFDFDQSDHISQSLYNTNQWVYNQNQLNQYHSFPMDSSGEFSTYYHKKIRAEQVRSLRQSASEREDSVLPRINQAFSRFNGMERDLTQPLHVQVSEESERILNYPITMAKNSSTHLLENIYNFKNSFIMNEPILKMVTTTNGTSCTYSQPIITTPMAQTSTVLSADLPASSMPDNLTNSNDVPSRLFNLLRAAEQEDTLRSDVRSTTSSISAWSPDNSISSRANVTIPEMVDDAMEIISQDGDYMERINMDVKIQCFVCAWAGPRMLFEHHLKKEHAERVENGYLVCARIASTEPTMFSPNWSQKREDQ